MENLTQSYGVVIPNVAAAPMEGYNVVVFEEVQGGTKFKTIIRPMDNPLKKKLTIISPTPTYNCFAVSLDINLNFDFSTEIMLNLQYQHFILTCNVYFQVSDPKLLATFFKRDPINRIKEEIKKKIQENILESKIQIEDIQTNFFGSQEKLIPNSTLTFIRNCAKNLGIIIKEINMTYKIPEKYNIPGIKIEDHGLNRLTEYIDKELKTKKQQDEISNIVHENKKRDLMNEQEIKNTQNQQQIENRKKFDHFLWELGSHLSTAIGNVINPIEEPELFKKTIDTILESVEKVGNKIMLSSGLFNAKKLVLNFDDRKHLMAKSPTPFDEVIQILLKITSIVENSSIPPDDKKVIFSSLNHIQEEIQLEEKADREMIEIYIEKLSDYINKYGNILTHDIVVQTKKLREKVKQLFDRYSETQTGAEDLDKSVTQNITLRKENTDGKE